MFTKKAKVWLCIGLVLFWGVAGLQGDNRLGSWASIEAAAQPPPQECKDAAGATIPCPPADDEDRGRTDCEDADRDEVCDSQEPSGCVGQLDELGNGCAAGDDQPAVIAIPPFIPIRPKPKLPVYPPPDCNDPDSAVRLLVPAVQKVREAAARSQTDEGCPDPEPEFDCNVNGPFAFCITFAGVEPEGETEKLECVSNSGGTVCCGSASGGSSPGCACSGAGACSALKKLCAFWGDYSGSNGSGFCSH